MNRRVWAIKGRGGPGVKAWPRKASSGKGGAPVFIVGVDTLKDTLAARLSVETAGRAASISTASLSRIGSTSSPPKRSVPNTAMGGLSGLGSQNDRASGTRRLIATSMPTPPYTACTPPDFGWKRQSRQRQAAKNRQTSLNRSGCAKDRLVAPWLFISPKRPGLFGESC